MRRHNRRLFRVTRSVLRDGDAAQDAVQETYLRAFTRLDSLPAQRKVRRLDHARGIQRSTDDPPTRARRHGVARRSRRRRLVAEETAASEAPIRGSIPRSRACARAARARHRCLAGELPHGVHAARGRRPRRARNRGVPRHQCRHGAHAPVPCTAAAARRAVAPPAGRKHRDFRLRRGALRPRRGVRAVATCAQANYAWECAASMAAVRTCLGRRAASCAHVGLHFGQPVLPDVTRAPVLPAG